MIPHCRRPCGHHVCRARRGPVDHGTAATSAPTSVAINGSRGPVPDATRRSPRAPATRCQPPERGPPPSLQISPRQAQLGGGAKERPTERRARQTHTAQGRSSPPLCPCRRFALAGSGGGGAGARPRWTGGGHVGIPVVWFVVGSPSGGHPVATSHPPLAPGDRWCRHRGAGAPGVAEGVASRRLDCLLLAPLGGGEMWWPSGNTFAPAGGPFLTPPAGASCVQCLELRGQTASPGSPSPRSTRTPHSSPS